jgi:hypothetical protein
MGIKDRLSPLEGRSLMGTLVPHEYLEGLEKHLGLIARDRTSLMSLGDDACRFRVHATDDPLAASTDVIDRRFAEPA